MSKKMASFDLLTRLNNRNSRLSEAAQDRGRLL